VTNFDDDDAAAADDDYYGPGGVKLQEESLRELSLSVCGMFSASTFCAQCKTKCRKY